MKKKLPWIVCLIAFVMFFSNVEYAGSAPPEATNPPEVSAPPVKKTDFGYLENITFEKIKGKERLTIVVSKQSGVTLEALAGNAVVVKMANMFVPEELKRPLGEGKLSNVINAVPSQKTTAGQNWALITIALRERVPYSVSQAWQNVLIDFNTGSIGGKRPAADQKTLETPTKITKKGTKPAEGQIVEKSTGAAKYGGRKISLDFQDAPIRAVLRLLAEEGGITIVSGDDVKGNMTVHMKKVPWDQALDTILDVHGLAKKQMGDVISVVTYERMKKDEADRKTGAEDRRNAEMLATKAEQERLEEKGKLRQISIEAKIVEATDEFVRNLGVTWGGVSYNRAGSYSSALTAGTNTSQLNTATWGYPSAIPFTNTDGSIIRSAAVNMPSALASPTFGLILGGANAVLEAQISALETTGQGKIISKPSVRVMDGVKAIIKQGQQIPVVTPATSNNPPTVTFKDAMLRLEVTPKITAEDKISMKIVASKDSVDYSRVVQGNYPIDTNMVESSVLIANGETIVIGGVSNSSESESVAGVPWFYKIPVLGWLFKSESTTKTGRKLIIFVTPTIIESDAVGEKSEKQM